MLFQIIFPECYYKKEKNVQKIIKIILAKGLTMDIITDSFGNQGLNKYLFKV